MASVSVLATPVATPMSLTTLATLGSTALDCVSPPVQQIHNDHTVCQTTQFISLHQHLFLKAPGIILDKKQTCQCIAMNWKSDWFEKKVIPKKDTFSNYIFS